MAAGRDSAGGSLGALIAPPVRPLETAIGRRLRRACPLLVALVAIATFRPTLGNGFLSLAFDDAIITDTAALHQLSWPNLRALLTEFNHAHYVPLSMLSLALDHWVWGLDPFGYHLTNIFLHALTSALVCIFLWPIAPSAGAALFAALVFAVHPVQLEAVSLAIQRKTLLSGALFFLTLILYQRWRQRGERRWYTGAVLVFGGAALAKPSAMCLPVLLLLYDYTFIDRRVRWIDKLPFAAIAAASATAAYAAHAAIGAMHPPHGGTLLTHVLMVSRVTWEYGAAVLLPVGLSPIYYYPRGSAYAPLNFVALAAWPALAVLIIARRRQWPWAFFCLGWFALTLLPESNLLPLAQLRADRFLYLGMAGAGLGFAVARQHLPAQRPLIAALGLVIVLALAATTYASAGIWHSDVSAWTRVVERHPWSEMAKTMRARAAGGADESAPR